MPCFDGRDTGSPKVSVSGSTRARRMRALSRCRVTGKLAKESAHARDESTFSSSPQERERERENQKIIKDKEIQSRRQDNYAK